jgi:hypothetical protein
MATSGEISGLGELIRALQSLPDELQREADGVVQIAAETTANDVRNAYFKAQKTATKWGRLRDDAGALANGVVIRRPRDGRKGSRAQVKSTAKHAHLYEFGTVQRFLSSNGANRGTMPPQPVFIPAAIRNRKWMVAKLTEIVNGKRLPGTQGSADVRERAGFGFSDGRVA